MGLWLLFEYDHKLKLGIFLNSSQTKIYLYLASVSYLGKGGVIFLVLQPEMLTQFLSSAFSYLCSSSCKLPISSMRSDYIVQS